VIRRALAAFAFTAAIAFGVAAAAQTRMPMPVASIVPFDLTIDAAGSNIDGDRRRRSHPRQSAAVSNRSYKM
jgi:hypothetical protein